MHTRQTVRECPQISFGLLSCSLFLFPTRGDFSCSLTCAKVFLVITIAYGAKHFMVPETPFHQRNHSVLKASGAEVEKS